MTKIKNFRIVLRPRDMTRWLKNQERLEITPALEASVLQAIKESKPLLQPAALYTTLTRATADKTTSLPLSAKAVAVSMMAITIGKELGEERARAEQGPDTLQAALLRAAEQEALSQSTQFIIRLLQEQAKEEECETGATVVISEQLLVPAFSQLLGVSRIGLAMDPAAPALPSYARLAWMEWTPVAKRSSKRSEAPSRSEKAAVS